MSDTDASSGLRDHAREAVRAEVQRRAWLLFSEHGFESTTVDRIATASGMSRRMFFRYFASKDDLVLARMVESGAELVAVLQARPAGEPPWVALRTAFQVIVDQQVAHAARSRQLQLMLRDEPAVRATVQEWRRRWTALLTPVVAARLTRTDDVTGLRAEALVRSALECLGAAQQHWAEHGVSAERGASAERGEEDLSRLVDVSMGAVHPLA